MGFLLGDWWNQLSLETVAAIVVAVFSAVLFEGWRIARALWRRIAGFFGARRRLRRLYREITRTRTKGRWIRPVSAVDRNLQRRMGESIPVLLVANQKGGVGKTTLAANLGAYFALKRKMRVLFVDLDFQGTLSAPLLAMSNQENQRDSHLPRLRELLLADFRRRIGQEMTAARVLLGRIRSCAPVKINTQEHPGNFGYSGYIDAGSGVGDLEDWLMMKWVARLDRSDIRFQLARFLHSPEVQEAYDIVILDAPPRNTTAGINGLCAATHIVIPSRADRFSWGGARRYLEEATLVHDLLAPQAKLCGFIGTMMTGAMLIDDTSPFLRQEIGSLQEEQIKDPSSGATRALASYWPSGSTFSYLGDVRASVAFADAAGVTVPYLVSNPVRSMIDPIGDRLVETIWQTNGKEAS